MVDLIMSCIASGLNLEISNNFEIKKDCILIYLPNGTEVKITAKYTA